VKQKKHQLTSQQSLEEIMQIIKEARTTHESSSSDVVDDQQLMNLTQVMFVLLL
jgi:hypothetical protein